MRAGDVLAACDVVMCDEEDGGLCGCRYWGVGLLGERGMMYLPLLGWWELRWAGNDVNVGARVMSYGVGGGFGV